MERELRRYERVAHQLHFCDRCCNYINAGEMYEGRVVLTDRRRLLVWKTHVQPSCDFPTDPDEDRDTLDKIMHVDFKLKLAA